MILLVEDDPSMLESMEELLEFAGYEVESVTNPNEAFRLMEAAPALPQLIVSDILMPGMDGFQFLNAVRARSWLHIPFLFISGQMTGADADTSPDGRTAFLPKPFSVDTLLAYMQHVLAATAPPVSSDRFAFLPRP